ncbi:putative transcriptional regulator [Crenothrix polyspora]|uniref:Putative transcriptional regulator n=1 Tax=Crenothrix polyspora TaxID=360316 RepID=A0A1R4H114_9GAMM|nr:helix-turn-helix transcriptional regulator [Crenothrix polyspora]SJM89896.1 putative transcriptional regulator [Crenothrix polyspora]
MINLGLKIKAIRKKSGMTQSDLAQKAQVTRQVISQIENGTFSGSVTKLEKVLAVLRYQLSIEVFTFPTVEELGDIFNDD